MEILSPSLTVHVALRAHVSVALLKRCMGKTKNKKIGPTRKDIELSPSGLPRRGSSLQKLKDFAPPFQRCSHRALFPLAPLRQAAHAPFHNARSLRCAQNLLRCKMYRDVRV